MSEERKLCREGQHVAVFNRYITCGIHTVPGYQGAPAKDVEQVILCWELTDEWKDEEKTQPIWKRHFGRGNMSNYDSDKAKKTTLLKAAFPTYNPKQRNGHAFLGKPCIVNIKHVEGKNAHVGKVFDNMDSLSAYPEILGDLDYEISSPVVRFDFYNPTQESWDRLLPFEQDYIREAKDFPNSKLAKMLGEGEETDDSPDF
jgi:hypothetical protein